MERNVFSFKNKQSTDPHGAIVGVTMQLLCLPCWQSYGHQHFSFARLSSSFVTTADKYRYDCFIRTQKQTKSSLSLNAHLVGLTGHQHVWASQKASFPVGQSLCSSRFCQAWLFSRRGRQFVLASVACFHDEVNHFSMSTWLFFMKGCMFCSSHHRLSSRGSLLVNFAGFIRPW